MRIGVVSDTHGQTDYARDAVRMFESLEVDAVLHCGDVGSPEIVPLFQAWPTHFVFGNVDHEVAALRRAIVKAKQTCHERFGTVRLAGVEIAFLHGDDQAALADAANSGRYGLVCYGHTHAAKQERVGRTLVLNPGAMYRAMPHSVAIVELPECTAEIIAV